MDYNIDFDNLPNHIAIILDGNGRWAMKKGLPRFIGHRHGAYNLINIIKECNDLGIQALTCFCFSTENWSRPELEVNYLMTIPIKYYKRYKNKLLHINCKIKILGRKTKISNELKNVFDEVENITKDNDGLILNLCVDYGSYEEITNAVKNISKEVLNGRLDINDITPDLIEKHLYTVDLPKLDLLIRTSGEKRISNFLLWQLAYSELYFTDIYWPDFNKDELYKALKSYQNRNRKFGGLKE